MKIIETTQEAHAFVRQNRKRRVLVPTMGGLHRGHMELVRVARETGKEVALSIFVNPLQFAPGSDFERYPRPEEADEKLCRDAGVDLLFRPSPNEMYLPDRSTDVEETALAQLMEGKARPGHFRGVTTVVTKLFNVLAPDAAVFGEKDFQQLAIIRRMVRDLNFPIEIIAVPTVRETDGLACSSRNQYLNEEERKQAPIVRMALLEGRAKFQLGEEEAAAVVKHMRDEIEAAPLSRVDYVEAVDAETLRPVEKLSVNTLLAAAVFFGRTRLIDNIRLL